MNCIHELIEAQAALTPDADALIFDATRLSYRELNRRADEVAGMLRAHGVGPDVLVALFLERSPDMIVGMLGVLKAGGAYVPLDPVLLPMKRLAYMLEDAKPLAVLTHKNLHHALPVHDATVILMDGGFPGEAAPLPGSRRPVLPDDLAYVIYTSGSTGQPKGVEIKHATVVNMLASLRRRPGLEASDRMLALTTLAFDIAVLEIFLPLICGASVIIAGGETARDGAALRRLIDQSDITVMQATPASLQMLLDAGWDGAPDLKILCGGEAWGPSLADQLLPRCGSLWNMYGPTETTVWSAVARVQAGQPIVIGRPIANTRLYVLDKMCQLVPIGIPGELYIAGDGLARGYLNRPELTAERFVTDPFAKSAALMYRTGDLVKRLPNGTLEFLGRLDQQVKIRGHRIELGEIETALAGHPAIERSVAMAYEAPDGGQNLAAYFIAVNGGSVPADEIRRFLGDRLPPYMIPSAFVPVAEFPLTPSGKLDRKALPPPGIPTPEMAKTFVEPVTPIEKQLTRIWCEMLNLKQLGVRDNYFDLGGHSLLALRTINEINKALHVQLNVPDFFQNPTIEQLAKFLDRDTQVRTETRVVQLQRGRSGLPVYFIGARPDEYRLAQMIGEDHPVFVIDALIPTEWMSGVAAEDEASLPTIEQLGELFGRPLAAHVGTAPCVIAGYSLGGKIAFEAARSLQREGGNVALLLLVDARAFAWSAASRLLTVWRSLSMIMGNGRVENGEPIAESQGAGALIETLWRLARWQIAGLPAVIKYQFEIIGHRRAAVKDPAASVAEPSGYFNSDGRPVEMWIIHRLAKLAHRSWRPGPLETAGVLIRAKASVDMLPSYDRTHGWRELFRDGFEVVQAEGDHLSILTDRHADSMARQLNDVLGRYGLARRTSAEGVAFLDLIEEQQQLKQAQVENQIQPMEICEPVAGRP
jgi:amino acid adenylation domain-containing protein